MTAWLLGALVSAASRRWGWAGLLTGLALASKQNALFFLPLVILLGVGQSVRRDTSLKDSALWLGRFALGIALPILLMIVWDQARGARVSFWDAGVEANDPGRLIRSSEIGSRLAGWWAHLKYAAGSSLATLILLALIGIAAWRDLRRNDRASACSLLIIAFLLAYGGLLWLVAFPLLDRYLLAAIPLVALLGGRASQILLARRRPPLRILALTAVLAALIFPALRASAGRIPIGGDHGAYDGIDQVAAYLKHLPYGTVIYHESLGWPLAYYLFDSYLFPVTFSSPAALTADLCAFGMRPEPRYLLMPAWRSQTEVLNGVCAAGYQAVVTLQTTNRLGDPSLILYRIHPLSAPSP
jgi:4-amino-4-deoxy-L-arabinose transferase-like glycosyltransferase